MAWGLRHIDGHEYLITGPGRLEIVFRDFDAAKVERPEDLGAEVLGTLMQRSWRYPMEPGLFLELISTSDTAHMELPEQHILYLGTCVSWHVPDAIAEALHALYEVPQ